MKKMEKTKKQGLAEMVNNSRHSDFFIILDDEMSAREWCIQVNPKNSDATTNRRDCYLPVVKPHTHCPE
jgi:hypothetical protein